eukprot:Clim_evm5s51 gene=Clim_evmTU5s51
MDALQQSELKRIFTEYAVAKHRADLDNILKSGNNEDHWGVVIDFAELLDFSNMAGNVILESPTLALQIFDDALTEVQTRIAEDLVRHGNERLYIKSRIHARLSHLPQVPDIQRHLLPTSGDVSSIIQLSGTVVRASQPKMLAVRTTYSCSTCHERFHVYADMDRYNEFPRPTRCEAEDPGAAQPCPGKKFSEVPGTKVMHDYQEIRMQEQITKVAVGTLPRAMPVVLTDDLTDKCTAGDDIRLTGIVRRRWRAVRHHERCDIEVFIVANAITVSSDRRVTHNVTDGARREFEALWKHHAGNQFHCRNEILKQFAPQLHGMYNVKLAVLLAIIGGVARAKDRSEGVRGESHILLVGDPGCGKSQVLKYASKLVPRSVFTSGVGTTSAGLTVSATKEGPDWILEAGALVLADCGLCCIDEFGTIREHDRSIIHEAMEQQTISVAKAGLVCKLNTRCAIIAASNPKGSYDPTEPLDINIGIASPLLSRFDLIFLLLDNHDEEWDSNVAQHILDAARNNTKDGTTANTRARLPQAETGDKSSLASQERFENLSWDMEKLQAYISVVREAFNPQLSDEADEILRRYYSVQRQNRARSAARTTIRLLESMVRIAQAHARLMFRDVVTQEDAVVTLFLMEISMASSQGTNSADTLKLGFPMDAQRDYDSIAEIIGNLLNMNLVSDDDDGGWDEASPGEGSPLGPDAEINTTELEERLTTDAATRRRAAGSFGSLVGNSSSRPPTSSVPTKRVVVGSAPDAPDMCGETSLSPVVTPRATVSNALSTTPNAIRTTTKQSEKQRPYALTRPTAAPPSSRAKTTDSERENLRPSPALPPAPPAEPSTQRTAQRPPLAAVHQPSQRRVATPPRTATMATVRSKRATSFGQPQSAKRVATATDEVTLRLLQMEAANAASNDDDEEL